MLSVTFGIRCLLGVHMLRMSVHYADEGLLGKLQTFKSLRSHGVMSGTCHPRTDIGQQRPEEKGLRTNARVSGQLEDLLLVLIAELEGCKAVLLPVDEVGLDHRCEDREAVLDIEGGVVAIGVDACT